MGLGTKNRGSRQPGGELRLESRPTSLQSAYVLTPECRWLSFETASFLPCIARFFLHARHLPLKALVCVRSDTRRHSINAIYREASCEQNRID